MNNAPGLSAAAIAGRSSSYRSPTIDIGTVINSRPDRPGTVRNGMYAGTGSTTGAVGSVSWSMTIRNPPTTDAIGCTSAGSTSQPYVDCHEAVARPTAASRYAGRYPVRPWSAAWCSAVVMAGASGRSISATQAPIIPGSVP